MHNLAALASDHFDVLVIGGGITGAGVALDAVVRGYKVALVEKSDFASSTSSKSTKLIHGGIRYLPEFDIVLVHEALVERGILLRIAPFLVTPIPFVLPIYEGDQHPVGMPFTTPGGVGLGFLLDMGLWMYDLLAGRRNIQRHRRLRRRDVERLAPTLLTNGLKEGFMYYDAQTNDARLTMTLIRTAAHYGATIANYSQVTSFLTEKGLVCGASVHDTLSNQTYTVRARHIVNASGVYASQVEALTGTPSEVRVEPSKGVHLVFSREALKLGYAAIVLPETEDKRVLFLVPWEARVIFGTTDTGSGDLDHPYATREDISYLLKYLNRYLAVHLTEEDIISSYAGYRPLVKPVHTHTSTARLSRTHIILQGGSGLVSIVGGKLTTYRRMAQDTVDVLSRRDGAKPLHPTQYLPLQGSAGWPRAQRRLERRGIALGFPSSTIQHLAHSYGTEANTVLDFVEGDASLAAPLIADLPYIKAEVLYACRHEMAMTPDDILARRTAIILADKQRGLGVLDEVTALMAREHGWSAAQQQSLMSTYRSSVQGQLIAEQTSEQVSPQAFGSP